MTIYTSNRIKREELKTIAHYTGYICVIVAIFMIVPLICGVYYHDNIKYINSFLLSDLFTFIIGLLLYFLFKQQSLTNLSLKASLIFVTSIWFIMSFFIALPFYLSGDLSFLDSFFEGMAAITTTGISLYPSTVVYPYSIAMWKCIVQWFGGLGIILLLLAIVPSSTSLKRLYTAEGRAEQITPNIKHTVVIFIKIYLILTLIGIVLYLLCGLDLFDAVCYCFASIATGGYSVNPISVDYFSNPLINTVTIILMIAGSTNFIIHYKIAKGNWHKIYKDVEVKAMAIIIVLSTIIISFNLYTNGYYGSNLIKIIGNSLFQTVSVMSSTGFQSTSIDYWPSLTYVIFIILMFIGGSMCSTTGGLKLYNVIIIFKSIMWEIERIILPKHSVKPHRIYHTQIKIISNEEIRHVLLFAAAYFFVFFVSVIILSFYSNNFEYVLFYAASAMGNTGFGPTFLTASSPILVKIVMIIDFWIGRVAVWPVLLMIVYFLKLISGAVEERFKNIKEE